MGRLKSSATMTGQICGNEIDVPPLSVLTVSLSIFPLNNEEVLENISIYKRI